METRVSITVDNILQLALSYAPKEESMALQRELLHRFVQKDKTRCDGLLTAALGGGITYSVPATLYALVSILRDELDVPVPEDFLQRFNLLSISKSKKSSDKLRAEQPVNKVTTPMSVNKSNTTETLSRKAKRSLIRSLLQNVSSTGIYSRYGCSKSSCKRCIHIFATYPITPCSKIHKSESCNPDGFYPHISRSKWNALHNATKPIQVRESKGSISNPLKLTHYKQIRAAIHAKCVINQAPTSERQVVTAQKPEEPKETVTSRQKPNKLTVETPSIPVQVPTSARLKRSKPKSVSMASDTEPKSKKQIPQPESLVDSIISSCQTPAELSDFLARIRGGTCGIPMRPSEEERAIKKITSLLKSKAK